MQVRPSCLVLVVAAAVSFGCEKKKPAPPAAPAPVAAPVPAPKPAQLAPVAQAPAAGAPSAEEKVPTPDEALVMLKEGNQRFVKGEHKTFPVGEDRKRLAKGQHPHTIVLSCSDSRVPPELVFDERLGDLFVVRVAGEALDAKVVASIEYAAAHLKTPQLLVMGHEHCGAVAASVKAKAGASAGSADLDALVAYLKPHAALGGKASAGYVEEAKSKTRFVAADLMKRSAILRGRASAGKLKTRTAIYHLETGEVEYF